MSWQASADFYHQMKVLTQSGLSIPQALGLAPVRAPYTTWAKTWAEATTHGSSLHEAMAASGERPFPVAMIQAGEKSGTLPERCTEISEFYRHCVVVRNLIISKLIYPFCLIHAALIFPAIPAVFLGNAPAWTIISGPAILWAIIGGFFLFYKISGKTDLLARIAMLPMVRFLTQRLVVSNTAIVSAAGLRSGMLVHEALNLAAPSCGNSIEAKRIRDVAAGVMEGRVPDMYAAVTALGWPPIFATFVANGETAGSLDSELHKVGTVAMEQFRERVLWTARVFIATVVLSAMITAAYTIISMWMNVYGSVLNAA